DILSTYGDVVTLKRGRDDQDKHEDPSAGSNRGMKRRKSSKDVEPSKGSKSKESKSSRSSKGTQSQPKSSGKSTQAKEPIFEAADTKMQYDQRNEFGHLDINLIIRLLLSMIGPKNLTSLQLLIMLGINQNMLTLDRLKNGSAPLSKNVTNQDNLLACLTSLWALLLTS
nr:hypothetical protein [Tanacetum cinerariifolium]